MNEAAAKLVMEEFEREDHARRQQEPLARAAAAVDKVADSTKKMWTRVRQTGGRSRTFHSTRLLDGDCHIDPIAPSPLDAAYEPPAALSAPASPLSMPSAYAARLDRARVANRAGVHMPSDSMTQSPSETQLSPDQPPPPPLAAPMGPQVGMLIDINV